MSRDSEPTDSHAADVKVSNRSPINGITRGIHFSGEIGGDADLTISGAVTGSVFLPGRRVLVTETGEVTADITCRVIEIEGRVLGNLRATDRVTIRKASHVNGNIIAPKIQLEEGCQFKGSVKMLNPEIELAAPPKPNVVVGHGTVRAKSATG